MEHQKGTCQRLNSAVSQRMLGAPVEEDITVGIRNYNRTDSLITALASVRAQSDVVKILVVDDGSNPSLGSLYAALASDFDFEVEFHAENLGGAAALNTLVACVKTEFLCLLDSDDVLSPTYFRTMLGAMKANPGYSAAYAPLQPRSEKWLPSGCSIYGEVLKNGFMAAAGGLLVRVSLLREFFPIVSRKPGAPFLDLCEDDRVSFEIAKRACVLSVPRVVYYPGSGSGNVSSDRKLMRTAWVVFYLDYADDFIQLGLASALGWHLGRSLGEGGLTNSEFEKKLIHAFLGSVGLKVQMQVVSCLAANLLRTLTLRVTQRTAKRFISHLRRISSH